jgi:diguanylate cyclase (GGDEF)-like protein
MILGLTLYIISLLCQILAAIFSMALFFRARSYRLACGFLAIGLTLMVGRRITPLVHALNDGYVNNADAILSVPISLFLLLGMIHFKKLLITLEKQNLALEHFTKTDSLTSAVSRSETLARLETEIKKSFRSKKAIAFLMVDIDHFKIVNDSYGHSVGDQVLKNLVNTCQLEIREVDIIGRVGGEEFLIGLPETTRKEALEVAERLREHVASVPCVSSSGGKIFITISIGVAIYDPLYEKLISPSSIVKKYYTACDEAMYRAKTAGRNQISE